MAIEIERKFLLAPIDAEKVLLDRNISFKKIDIEQFYLSTSEYGVDRYRKEGDRYIHTEKVGFGLIREEIESEISEDEYYKRKKKHKGKFIKKTRFVIEDEKCKNRLEIDEFKKPLSGLVILEAEFNSKKSSYDFTPPEFIKEFVLKEVTNYKEFTNGYLSRELKFPKIKYHIKNIIDDITNQNLLGVPFIEIRTHSYMEIKDAIFILLYSHFLIIETEIKKILKSNYRNREQLNQLVATIEKLKVILKEFQNLYKKRGFGIFYKYLSEFMLKVENIKTLEIYFENMRTLESNCKDKMVINSLKNEIRFKLDESFKDFIKFLRVVDKEKMFSPLRIDEILKSRKSSSTALTTPTIINYYQIVIHRYNNLQESFKRLERNSKDKDFKRVGAEVTRFSYLIELFRYGLVGFKSFDEVYKLKELQKLFEEFNNLLLEIDFLKSIEELKLLKNRFWDIKEKKKLEILQKKEDFEIDFRYFQL